MGDDESRIVANVHSFAAIRQGGAKDEGYTRDEITLAGPRTSWRIVPHVEGNPDDVTESDSRDVNRYLREVIEKKRRTIRRNTVRAVPKPTGGKGKRRTLAEPTDLPCPRCDGEGLPGCRLCEGAGRVSPIEAAAWEAEHG